VETSKIEIRVTFKGLDSSDAVKEYAEKRVVKVAKHLHSLSHCDLVFMIEKNDHIAQAHLVSSDFEAKAEARAENMYAAIDALSDKLVQQTRKHKEKSTNKSVRGHHAGLNEIILESESMNESED
jgi:putative sigma-54 modulation protein